ncbi:unnamed protein product [Malus baccata var. baccata]
MTGTMNQPYITEERMENVHSVKFPTIKTTSSSVLRGSYDGVPPPATASRLLSAAMRGGHGVNSRVL